MCFGQNEKISIRKRLPKSYCQLTSSSALAHPAEPRAGQTASPMTDLLVLAPCQAHKQRQELKRSPYGGSSWLQSRTCAGYLFAHTAGAGGASSCEGYFVHSRELSGSGLSTVKVIIIHQKGSSS